MRRRAAFFGVALGVITNMAVAEPAPAPPPVSRVSVLLEMMVNPVGQVPAAGCSLSAQIEPNAGTSWWMVVSPGEGEGPVATCQEDPGAQASMPEIQAGEVAVQAVTVLRRRSGSHDPYVEIEVSTHRSGGDEAQQGQDGSSARSRRLYFDHDEELIIPAFVAQSEQQGELGVREVLVRLEIHRPKAEGTEYGSVQVSSSVVGAEILLDGGAVGTVIEDSVTSVRHVRAGARELRLRQGLVAGPVRVLQIDAGRTVPVELGLEPAAEEPWALEPLGRNEQGFEEYRRPRDGGTVVRIPEGKFLMGNRNTERQPLEHEVFVSEFLIDKTEVTWAQYKRFLMATGRPLPPFDPYWGIHDDHVAVFVNWEESKAHCEWAGARLATEAEWEKAARGMDGRKYPWGDNEPEREWAVHRRGWGFTATDPADAHPEGMSPYGLFDMGGSVWEWCSDWYADDYYEVSPERDPPGPPTGLAHVVRGGSWDSRPDVLSCSCRSWGHRGYREGDFGFRCAMDPP